MTKAEQTAREKIRQMDTQTLLATWELTTVLNDPNIPTVRGWLMDEFKYRNPVGYNKWLDTEYCLDEDLKKFI